MGKRYIKVRSGGSREYSDVKIVNLISGKIMLALTLSALGGAVVIENENCATTQIASDVTGAPLCSTTLEEAIGLAFLGFVFGVISFILLFSDSEPKVRPPSPPSRVAPLPLQICLKCGTQRTSAAPFCPFCGTAYPRRTHLPPPPPPSR